MSAKRKLVLTGNLLMLVAGPAAVAQQQRAVETMTAEVFKRVGNSVIIKNEDGELKMYHAIPDGVRLFVDGEPAQLSDLREGMVLRAIRFENAPEPISVSPEQAGGIATEEDAAAVAAASAAAGSPESEGAVGSDPTESSAAQRAEAAAALDEGGSSGGVFPLIALAAVAGLVALIIVVMRRG